MIYLLLASLLWSFSFGLIKAQLTGLDPFFLSAIRLLLSFLIFVPFLSRGPSAPGTPSPSRGLTGRLIAIGAIQFGLMYCFYIFSFRFLGAAEVALLTITTPLYVVLFDALMQRTWKPRYWLSAMLATATALVLVIKPDAKSPGFAEASMAPLLGALLVQGSNACFAAGQLFYKSAVNQGESGEAARGEHRHFAWLYLGGMLVPALILLPQSLIAGVTVPSTIGQWLSLLYLGVIPSGLAFFLWNKGTGRVDNGMIAITNNLKIPLSVLIAWGVFGESLELGRLAVAGVLGVTAIGILNGVQPRG